MRSFWSLYSLKNSCFWSENLMGCRFLPFLNDSFLFSPHVPFHVQPLFGQGWWVPFFLICTLNYPNALAWIEMCPFLSIRVNHPSPISPSYRTVCPTKETKTINAIGRIGIAMAPPYKVIPGLFPYKALFRVISCKAFFRVNSKGSLRNYLKEFKRTL